MASPLVATGLLTANNGDYLVLQKSIDVPLVAPSLLARRAIAVTNVAALGVRFAMFCAFLGISYFVQMPAHVAGYGFTASVLAASAAYLMLGRSSPRA